jgi:hypothetical protein
METIEYKRFKIKIKNMDNPPNPLEKFDGFTVMHCFHDKYQLGDENPYLRSNYNSWEEFRKEIIRNEGSCAILPLYLYDHSGITINTTGFNCSWDSGQVGWAYIPFKKAYEQCGWKRVTCRRLTQMYDWIRSEVAYYDNYLIGNVYEYEIIDETGHPLDSCSGYYGYDHEQSGLLESAKSCIDYYIEKRDEHHGVQQVLEL